MKGLAAMCAVPSTAGGRPRTSEGTGRSGPSSHGGLALHLLGNLGDGVRWAGKTGWELQAELLGTEPHALDMCLYLGACETTLDAQATQGSFPGLTMHHTCQDGRAASSAHLFSASRWVGFARTYSVHFYFSESAGYRFPTSALL